MSHTDMDLARAKIYQYPDPVLREVSRPVPIHDADTMAMVRQLVGAMKDTMRAAAGWGLSAIQIGVPIRVFVVHVPSETEYPLVFVNPVIEAVSDQCVTLLEGCLSFNGVREPIERPESVLVRRWNERGVSDTCEFKAWTARAIQHEMDHLSAVLLVDKLGKSAAKMFERRYSRQQVKREAKELTT